MRIDVESSNSANFPIAPAGHSVAGQSPGLRGRLARVGQLLADSVVRLRVSRPIGPLPVEGKWLIPLQRAVEFGAVREPGLSG